MQNVWLEFFFEMTKGGPAETRASKLDALRMKKYYSYYIKQNRSKPLEWLEANAMAPLNHLFGNHTLCSSNWCTCKAMEERPISTTEGEKVPDEEIIECKENDAVDKRSERAKAGYYRCMINDKALYEEMKERYAKFISHNFLKQCKHEYDTQMNEGMNNSIAYFAPKGMNFCGSLSLQTRVYIAAGVQLAGHHFFWKTVLRSLDIDIPHQFELALIKRDRNNARKFFRVHDHKNMATRNRRYHEKFRMELVKAQNDKKRGAVYASKKGCDVTSNKNVCTHSKYGCGGGMKHKSARSKKCLYYGSKGPQLVAKWDTWVATKNGLTEGTNTVFSFDEAIGGGMSTNWKIDTHINLSFFPYFSEYYL